MYAAAAARAALPLAVLPLLASRIGADAFGRLSFILVWSALLSTIVEGGFLAAATRLAVHADAAERWRLARQVFSARCVLALLTGLVAFIAIGWLAPVGTHAVSDGAAIAALACALGAPATWYLQATQQLKRWARVELAVYGLLLAGCWAFATSVVAFVLLQLAASASLSWAGWRWLRRDLAAEAAGASLWAASAVIPGLRLGATMLPIAVAGAAYSFALPAAASAQMARAELGAYVMVDRIVRVFIAAAEPMFALVYPRIVLMFQRGARAALRYTMRCAAIGATAGVGLMVAGLALRPWLEPIVMRRLAGFDPAQLAATFGILAWLWPLLLGWKFFGYWMLGSGRFDIAYRVAMIGGALVGVSAAGSWSGAARAPGLAGVAVAVEAFVVIASVVGVWVTLRLRPPAH